MHLHHPALSYNGKKKGKVKFASAEAKRKAEQLDKEWKELQAKWGVDAEEKKRRRAMTAETLEYKLEVPAGRDTKHIKSIGQASGVAIMPPAKVYTGDKVKGIATMHKSNAVPVFSDEEAISISSMRR
jgi:hypothetical protein